MSCVRAVGVMITELPLSVGSPPGLRNVKNLNHLYRVPACSHFFYLLSLDKVLAFATNVAGEGDILPSIDILSDIA